MRLTSKKNTGDPKKNLTGRHPYIPLLGVEQTRRDDLQSLAYVLGPQDSSCTSFVVLSISVAPTPSPMLTTALTHSRSHPRHRTAALFLIDSKGRGEANEPVHQITGIQGLLWCAIFPTAFSRLLQRRHSLEAVITENGVDCTSTLSRLPVMVIIVNLQVLCAPRPFYLQSKRVDTCVCGEKTNGRHDVRLPSQQLVCSYFHSWGSYSARTGYDAPDIPSRSYTNFGRHCHRRVRT